jgi:hypothetical protein
MSAFSDKDIIANNPIGDSLNEIRRLLKSKCKDLGISWVGQLVETSRTGKSMKLRPQSTLILSRCQRFGA